MSESVVAIRSTQTLAKLSINLSWNITTVCLLGKCWYIIN